ncbi:hypothetical protein [Kibdelosporangium philippinense]|uniref:hypothetical protein n=1 Tax=Kibdelosporangium philippinense TaxID=211113 RepID=UPI003615B742
MSTVPTHRVHHCDTMKYTFQHTEFDNASARERLTITDDSESYPEVVSAGRFHCVGMVDTVCWSGGHTVPERWTRCVGTCVSVCRNGGHARVLPGPGIHSALATTADPDNQPDDRGDDQRTEPDRPAESCRRHVKTGSGTVSVMGPALAPAAWWLIMGDVR